MAAMFPAHGPTPRGTVAATCPRFTIDLDLPAAERWSELINVYRETIRSADRILDSQLREALPRMGPLLRGVAETAASTAAKLDRVMYRDDLQAFADLCDIPLGRCIALQLIYEASALCTSVVAPSFVPNPRDEDDDGGARGASGSVPAHIRTMDWEMNFLRPLTVELLFVRGSTPICIATTWAGYVGILTGMKCNPADPRSNFSVSVNFRAPGDGTFWTNISGALSGSWPIGFLVRECLQHADGFDAAAKWLRASDLIAPCYVTIAGAAEGSGQLITRSRVFVEPNAENPNPDTLLPLNAAPHGAIVQTNADHWVDTRVHRDEDIMESAERRDLVYAGLRARSQQQSETDAANPQWAESLWEVMSRYPVCNEITIYGTLMVPALGIYETRIPSLQTPPVDPKTGRGARRALRLGLRAVALEASLGSGLTSQDNYPMCKNCGQRFDATVNAPGQCAHAGPWHATYADCQKLKCGWGLGPSNLGKQHWGCCFSTERSAETPCEKSTPHVVA